MKWKLPLKKQTAQSGAQLFTRKELAVFTAPMITEQFIIVLAGVLGTRLISGIGESQIAAVSLAGVHVGSILHQQLLWMLLL